MKKVTLFALHAFLILWLCQCKKNSGDDKPKKVVVTSIAGTGEAGYVDASAAFAKFSRPFDVAVHSDGTIYIADQDNNRVRKLTTTGLVVTFAGNGNSGFTNGSVTAASFRFLRFIALDAAGDVYTLEQGNTQVRKITGGTQVAVFAGTGVNDFADGRVDSAHFGISRGITIDNNGAVYIADTYNARIRKIANGYVTTLAGTGTEAYRDGDGLQAHFNKPEGIAVDMQGNLYVCDTENYRIRKITPAGTVSTFAGNGIPGKADGEPGTAQFHVLRDMVIDKKGNLFVIDDQRIRKISPDGEVTTIAGTLTTGSEDGEGSMARFWGPSGLGIDAAGNIYVADQGNNRIRKISFE